MLVQLRRWKGKRVEHYDSPWAYSAKAKKSAEEVARRCRILEARGEIPSTHNVIWSCPSISISSLLVNHPLRTRRDRPRRFDLTTTELILLCIILATRRGQNEGIKSTSLASSSGDQGWRSSLFAIPMMAICPATAYSVIVSPVISVRCLANSWRELRVCVKSLRIIARSSSIQI